MLVYQENIDEIIGYVHAFDLFKSPKTIREFLRPITFVPETIYISKLLDTLTKKHQSMAIVFDEYGGTSGLITLEDIVEELFGEIEDEHDQNFKKELQISDKEYVFSARLEVDYINEKYRLSLPESENYETLGGLVVAIHEAIPCKDEEVSIENYRFLVEEVADNKVITVRIFVSDKWQVTSDKWQVIDNHCIIRMWINKKYKIFKIGKKVVISHPKIVKSD